MDLTLIEKEARMGRELLSHGVEMARQAASASDVVEVRGGMRARGHVVSPREGMRREAEGALAEASRAIGNVQVVAARLGVSGVEAG